MRGSNLAGTISGKLKMVYDVLTLNPQMRVPYVLTLSNLLAADDGKLDLKRSIDDLVSAGFRLSKKRV